MSPSCKKIVKKIYEGHYTRLGYYATQGVLNTGHIGVKGYLDLELNSVGGIRIGQD